MTKTELAKRLLKRVFVKEGHLEYCMIGDKLDGEYKSRCYNGQLFEYRYYINGKIGERKRWYENGQLYIHSYYKDNKLDGEYKVWHEDGQLWEHSYYKDGVVIKEYD